MYNVLNLVAPNDVTSVMFYPGRRRRFDASCSAAPGGGVHCSHSHLLLGSAIGCFVPETTGMCLHYASKLLRVELKSELV